MALGSWQLISYALGFVSKRHREEQVENREGELEADANDPR